MEEELDLLQTFPYAFTIRDSKIPSAENDYIYATFDEFFSVKYDGMARLIYAANTIDVVDAVKNIAITKGLRLSEDSDDLA